MPSLAGPSASVSLASASIQTGGLVCGFPDVHKDATMAERVARTAVCVARASPAPAVKQISTSASSPGGVMGATLAAETPTELTNACVRSVMSRPRIGRTADVCLATRCALRYVETAAFVEMVTAIVFTAIMARFARRMLTNACNTRSANIDATIRQAATTAPVQPVLCWALMASRAWISRKPYRSRISCTEDQE